MFGVGCWMLDVGCSFYSSVAGAGALACQCPQGCMSLSSFSPSIWLCCPSASRNGRMRGGWDRLGKKAEVIRRWFSQLPAHLIDLLLELDHPQLAAHRQTV